MVTGVTYAFISLPLIHGLNFNFIWKWPRALIGADGDV